MSNDPTIVDDPSAEKVVPEYSTAGMQTGQLWI